VEGSDGGIDEHKTEITAITEACKYSTRAARQGATVVAISKTFPRECWNTSRIGCGGSARRGDH